MVNEHLEQQHACIEAAGLFMAEMNNFTSGLALDYSTDSLQRLDSFITEYFLNSNTTVSEIVIYRTGCYLGEVVRRNLGGTWSDCGKNELCDIRNGITISPIEEAKKCFVESPPQKLSWYYHTLDKNTYINEQTSVKKEKPSGMFASLARIIGR